MGELAIHIAALAAALGRGDRRALARAITLVESTREDHRDAAERLLAAVLPPSADRSIRLGISGAPGVGKSTFIEAFGLMVIERGHQVAVLAVDPSSKRGGGSTPGRQDADGGAGPERSRASSGRRPPARRWAASPGARARRFCSARPPASTASSSRPSASANPRPRSPTWSTCSCCCWRPAPATSCRASRRASSSSPTSSWSTRPTAICKPAAHAGGRRLSPRAPPVAAGLAALDRPRCRRSRHSRARASPKSGRWSSAIARP